jgi:hypothetical protein
MVTFAALYFATLFCQEVLGYSALKSDVAYLPWSGGFVIGSAASTQLLPRIGPAPLGFPRAGLRALLRMASSSWLDVFRSPAFSA